MVLCVCVRVHARNPSVVLVRVLKSHVLVMVKHQPYLDTFIFISLCLIRLNLPFLRKAMGDIGLF